MAKSAVGTTPVSPGQTFDYELVVTNAGPSTASGIAVSDTLAAPLAFVSSTDCTGTVGEPGGTVSCPTIGTLPVGGQVTYRLTVRLSPSYAGDGSDVANTATATPTSRDPDPSDNLDAAGLPGGSPAPASVDLSVTRSAPASATAGDAVTYTFTVANAGPSDAQGVVVTGTLPAGLTYISASGAACTRSGQAVTCVLGELAAGDSVDFGLTVAVDASVAAGVVLTNSAEVTTSSADTDASNDTNTTALAVTAVAAVSITKAAPAAMAAGADATYPITVTNTGPSDAQDVTVTDTLDAGLSFVSATGASCTPAGQLVTCTVGHLAAGDEADIALTVAVDETTGAGAEITNTATVSTSTPNSSSATSSTVTGPPITAEADVVMSKSTVGTAAVAPGETFDFRLSATNTGPATATGVAVTDALPQQLVFVSSTDGCTGDAGPTGFGGTVACPTVATLAAGSEVSFTVTVRLDPAYIGTGTAVTNQASVATTSTDPDATDNSASAGLPTGAAAPARADLSLAKALDSPGPVTPGETFTYTFTGFNAGPSDGVRTRGVDPLPAPLTFLGDVEGATCATDDNNVVTCVFDRNFQAGTTETRQITVRLDPAYTGDGSDLVNSAFISSDTADPDLSNNGATSPGPTVGPGSADVRLTKGFAASQDEVIVPGDTVDYLLTLDNAGPSVARNVVVTDQLPPELAFVSSDDGCTGTVDQYGGAVACPTVSALGLDDRRSFVVRVRLSPDVTSGPVVNTISSTAATADPDPSNNTAVATLGPTEIASPSADVSIAKAAPSSMVAGQTAVWRLTLANAGPSTAAGVTVVDQLDAHLSFVSSSPGVCSASGQTVICAVGALPPGASPSVIDLTVLVAGGTPFGTVIGNTATVGSDTADADPSDNSSSVQGPPVQVVTDLGVTKQLDPSTPGPVVPGETFAYLVTVTNNGTSYAAEEVVVTDPMPSELSFVSAVDQATGEPVPCTFVGDVASCDAAALLLPTSSVTAVVTVRLDPAYTGDGSGVTNTISVSAANLDPDLSNNTSSASGVPGGVSPASADVDISAETATSVVPGARGTLAVTVTDNGPSASQPPIEVTVGMPDDVLADTAGQPSGCTTAPDRTTVTCSVDDVVIPPIRSPGTTSLRSSAASLPVGRTGARSATGPAGVLQAGPVASWSGVIGFAVAPDAPGGTTLSGGSAVVAVSTADAVPPNNSDPWVVQTLAAQSDLVVTKSVVGSTDVSPGDTVDYEITVLNNGPSTAVDVTTTDDLPEALAAVSASAECTGAPGPPGGVVTCGPIATLAPGARVGYRLTAAVGTAAATPEIVNQATVTAATADPDPGDNLGAATVTDSAVANPDGNGGGASAGGSGGDGGSFLAFTGFGWTALALAGGAAFLIGVACMGLARRRRAG